MKSEERTLKKEDFKRERVEELDMLRGVAILAMVLIHTTVYFLSDHSAFWIWNISQFAVPVFVFCSAYLFFLHPSRFTLNAFKKRFLRLLIPYYIFIPFFFAAMRVFQPSRLTPQYIMQSITLTGGIDINWLVLLFLYFALLFPFIQFLFSKNKVLFSLSALCSLLFSLCVTFIHIPLSYKVTMWFPWALIAFFTMILQRKKEKKWFYPLTIGSSAVIFILFFFIEKSRHMSLNFIDNKYPPNIYFLSYGILGITVLFYLAKKGVFGSKVVKNILTFFSRYSYSIYFIHYTFLYVLSFFQTGKGRVWEIYFFMVLISTVIVQLAINYTRKAVLA